ncbi:MAG: hypothetical protein COV73_01045, partial [Candidatus Omnitrophica bacterium CG11_big_fil_rev_8_21_14_0_20_43_6]
PLLRYTDIGSDENDEREGIFQMHELLQLKGNVDRKIAAFHMLGVETEARAKRYIRQNYEAVIASGFGKNPNHRIVIAFNDRGRPTTVEELRAWGEEIRSREFPGQQEIPIILVSDPDVDLDVSSTTYRMTHDRALVPKKIDLHAKRHLLYNHPPENVDPLQHVKIQLQPVINEMLLRIVPFAAEGRKVITVSIDGGSGTGKSTLAEMLVEAAKGNPQFAGYSYAIIGLDYFLRNMYWRKVIEKFIAGKPVTAAELALRDRGETVADFITRTGITPKEKWTNEQEIFAQKEILALLQAIVAFSISDEEVMARDIQDAYIRPEKVHRIESKTFTKPVLIIVDGKFSNLPELLPYYDVAFQMEDHPDRAMSKFEQRTRKYNAASAHISMAFYHLALVPSFNTYAAKISQQVDCIIDLTDDVFTLTANNKGGSIPAANSRAIDALGVAAFWGALGIILGLVAGQSWEIPLLVIAGWNLIKAIDMIHAFSTGPEATRAPPFTTPMARNDQGKASLHPAAIRLVISNAVYGFHEGLHNRLAKLPILLQEFIIHSIDFLGLALNPQELVPGKKKQDPTIGLAIMALVSFALAFIIYQGPDFIPAVLAQAKHLFALARPELVNLLNAFLGVNLFWFFWQAAGYLINRVLIKAGFRAATVTQHSTRSYQQMIEQAMDEVLAGKPELTAPQRNVLRERLDLLVMQHYGNNQSAKYQVTTLLFMPFLKLIQRYSPAAYPFVSLLTRLIGDIVDLVLILPVLYKFALRYGFIRFGFANMILNQQVTLSSEELAYLAKQALGKDSIRQKISLGRVLDAKLIKTLRKYDGSRRQKISIYLLATIGAFYALASTRVLLKLISAKLVQPLIIILFPVAFLGTPLFTIPAITILGIPILTAAMPISVSMVLSAFLVVLILDLLNGARLWHSFRMNKEERGSLYAGLTSLVELFEGVEGMVLVNSEIEAAINFSTGVGQALDNSIGNLIGVPLNNMLISPGKLVSSPVLVMERWVYGAQGYKSIGDAVWDPIEHLFGRVVLGRDDFELGQAIYGLGKGLAGRQDLPETLKESESMIQMLARRAYLDLAGIDTGKFNTPEALAIFIMAKNPQLLSGVNNDNYVEIREKLLANGVPNEAVDAVMLGMMDPESIFIATFVFNIQAEADKGRMDAAEVAQQLTRLDQNLSEQILFFLSPEVSDAIIREMVRIQSAEPAQPAATVTPTPEPTITETPQTTEQPQSTPVTVSGSERGLGRTDLGYVFVD